MVVRLVSGASALILGAGLIVGVGAGPASAVSPIMVTSAFCTGAGSLHEAVVAANANPGPDIIEFTPGLEVRAQGCPPGASGYYLAEVSEALTIKGNGARVRGEIDWATSGGLISPLDECPRQNRSDIITASTPGFLRVADGVDVVVEDLRLESLNSIAEVRANSSLVLEDVSARRILSIHDCVTAAIEVYDGSSLTLRRNNWNEVVHWPGVILPPLAVAPAVQGGSNTGAGDLVIEDSSFSFLSHGSTRSGLFSWAGAAGSTVNVVSTSMNYTGGMVVSGAATTNIVNSGWSAGAIGVLTAEDPIVNASTGVMNVVASTFMAPAVDCYGPCALQDYSGFFRQTAGAGKIRLSQTAIGVNFPESDTGLVLRAESPPGFEADGFTWIQPKTNTAGVIQDADALKLITGQSALLTDPPGLSTITGDPAFVPLVSPLLGTPAPPGPGALIDVIDCATYPLLNPIDGSEITTDVLGNPRCDTGNAQRNIGAVQLTLSPHLSVTGTGDRTVTLAWNRPQDPPSGVITGYAVKYRLSGSADAWTRLVVPGADTLTIPVTGLTNGAEYEFSVVGVNGTGDGPDSNTVLATPFGTPGAPVVSASAGDGTLTASWTEPASGGHPGPAAYTLALVDTVTGATTVRGPISARTASFPGLVNGHPYQVQVFATWTDGVSGNAGQATATPYGAIGTPVLSARGVAQGIRATWTAPSTGGHTLSGYRVSLRQIGTTRKQALTTTSRSATVTGLKPGRAYRVCVTARMTDGTRSAAACRTRVSGVRATATLRVRFGEQSPVLTSAQKRRLVAALPRDRGSISSVIAIGYVQRARDNSKALWLSRARARSVTSFLRTRGVAASTRIAGRGIGGTTPAWRAVDVTIRYYR